MFGEFHSIIGDTPLIKINYEYKSLKKSLYTKLEMFSFTGSIKDRVAYYMIKRAIEKNRLKKGMPIVEATSGNTGISLSAIGAKLGFDVVIFMPDWVSQERVQLMRAYGADVRLVSHLEGGFSECMKRAREFAMENNGYYMNQFANQDNVLAHYETTALEINNVLNGEVEAFVSGIGSGGTIMGIGKFLKEQNKKAKIIALEPLQMPLLSGGEIFSPHQIEGIGDEFIPEIVDEKLIDDILLIDDIDAILMAQKITENLGLGVGISSGANFLASVLVKEKTNGNVVTVFADDNKKYLTTNLTKEINKKHSIVKEIKLIDFEIV